MTESSRWSRLAEPVLYGAYLAKELNIPTVIIPPYPGVAAAMGCLLVDVRHDISKTYLKQASEVTLKQLLNEFESMQAEAKVLLQKKEFLKNIPL